VTAFESNGTAPTVEAPGEPSVVSLRAAAKVWAMIGLLSFGGPAGQIALMHKELVEKRRWIDEARFLHALNYCMLLPGPEAQQLAVYIGWLMHRTVGGLIAGILFIVPGAIAIFALSILYIKLHHLPTVESLFFGLRAAVLALVISAMVKISKRSLKSPLHYAVAIAALVALLLFAVPFPLIIVCAGFIGWLTANTKLAVVTAGHESSTNTTPAQSPSIVDQMAAQGLLQHTEPSLSRALRTLLLCLALWALPIVLISAYFGTQDVLFHQAVFFSETAVVTFGGAYAVLSYISQRAVSFGWLLPSEMMTGLGLAETTPGPLILVLQFVAFLGGYRHPGALDPMLAGVLASCVTLWVTFVPCFLWIFVGAPYIEKLRTHRSLNAAMQCTSAAVVGVIANLTVVFALTSLFGVVNAHHLGPLSIPVPDLNSLHWIAVALAVLGLVALIRFRIHVIWVLATSAVASVILREF
jgi:chromate transporter